MYDSFISILPIILAYYLSGAFITFILGMILNKTLHATIIEPKAIFFSWIPPIWLFIALFYYGSKTFIQLTCMKLKCKRFWQWYKNEIYN